MRARPFILLAVAGVFAVLLAQTGWTRLGSKEYRFSTFAPPGWQPLIPNSHTFPVINFPQSERVEGAVIPESGALIDAGPVNRPVRTIADAVRTGMPAGAEVTLDQTLLISTRDSDACQTLREVGWDVNLGDADHPVFEHTTEFYCEVHSRLFAVGVDYYHGNKDAAMLNALALTVAKDLRIGN